MYCAYVRSNSMYVLSTPSTRSLAIKLKKIKREGAATTSSNVGGPVLWCPAMFRLPLAAVFVRRRHLGHICRHLMGWAVVGGSETTGTRWGGNVCMCGFLSGLRSQVSGGEGVPT